MSSGSGHMLEAKPEPCEDKCILGQDKRGTGHFAYISQLFLSFHLQQVAQYSLFPFLSSVF